MLYSPYHVTLGGVTLARVYLVAPRVGAKCRIGVETTYDGYSVRYCYTHGTWILECLQCGEQFHALRSDAKYGSAACKQKAYRERVTCGA